MIPRTLAGKLSDAAKHHPVVTLTGPRQSGKTTLARAIFPDYAYVSLELPDQRVFAAEDPRGFLNQFHGPVILDKVQRVPDLFSYIQVMVDELDHPGQFIMTGSQNFLLLHSITQSLAGRAAVLHLLPFSLPELTRQEPMSIDDIGHKVPQDIKMPQKTLMETLFTGFYPRIHDKALPPMDWLGNYYQTYLERDVRNVLNIGDLETFSRFVRLCAGRNAQLLNLSSLAADCGITHTTARRWISLLDASFIIRLLRPYHNNFGKRLIKSPKLYFLDTGLLCYLLQLKSSDDLYQHASRGSIFEGFVVSEFIKYYFHNNQQPQIYFWRNSAGREIDLVIDQLNGVTALEIKSSQTIASDFFDGLHYWRGLSDRRKTTAALVYGGENAYMRSEVGIYPWFYL